MEKWEIALNKFLEKWRNKKEVIGAIVCGSYITRRPTKHSYIDLRIVLSNDVDYRERENKIVDGFLIEYFMNPIKQELKYFESDFPQRKKIDIHMYLKEKEEMLKQYQELSKYVLGQMNWKGIDGWKFRGKLNV